MPRTVLTNGRLNGAPEAQTLVIEDGRIAKVLAVPPPAEPGEERLDLAGQIVLPGFVDGHAHLDMSLWGEPWVRRTSEAITMEQMFADTLQDWRETTTPSALRGGRFLAECIRHGSTNVRTFANVAPEIGLEGVHGMLEVRAAFAEQVDLEIIAFGQIGVLSHPGTADFLDEALKLGIDGVAGVDPAGIDGDAKASLDTIFGLAGKYGVAVDFHLHETGELGRWLIKQIAERTKALGLQGKVSLCDVFCLAEPWPTPDQLAETSRVLADAGIAVAVGVHGLLPVPDVRRLAEFGVPMCLGSDSSRSRWSPWGDGDILARAMMLSYKSYFRRDEDLEFALSMTSQRGRAAFGYEKADLAAGDVADLLVLPGEALGELVVLPPPRSLVMKRGKIVARDGALTQSPSLIG
ncbi:MULTISPECIES: amidohydrolase family protein [Amycolatopsis]|uniref:Amidohydrolase family protein n=1 Tax=Amycolatopsis albidoflavus TaxID=102226 RepID=A0ABW5HXG6_9PSEU